MGTTQRAEVGGADTHIHLRQMLETHPRPSERFAEAELLACIEACYDCAQTCTSCADACLPEDMVKELVHCIRLNLDCADVCDTTGRLLTRQTEPDEQLLRAQIEACRAACAACGAECGRHASHHRHCAVCAEACRRCEQACQRLLATSGSR